MQIVTYSMQKSYPFLTILVMYNCVYIHIKFITSKTKYWPKYFECDIKRIYEIFCFYHCYTYI